MSTTVAHPAVGSRFWLAVAGALLGCATLACGSESSLFGSGATGGGTASGSGGVGGSSGTGGEPGSGGIGACDGVDQPSVSIVITNHLAESRYIDWTSTPSGLGHVDSLRYERQVGNDWEPVPFAKPNTDCVSRCSTSNHGNDGCCRWCSGLSPSMQVIPPGQAVQRGWSGLRYVTDDTWCDCPCFWECQPAAGHYRVLVDTYAAISCGGDPCEEPDEYGSIEGAVGDGEPTAYTAELDVLYPDEELHVAIE